MSHRNTPSSFWDRVDKTGDCWIWELSVNKDGYGSVKYQGRTMKAHILAYILAVGPIPEGMEIHHTCGNRRCCKPSHFRLLPHVEHLVLHRKNRVKTVCKRGHAWILENTLINRKGYKVCRECLRISHRKWVAGAPGRH